MSKAKRAGNAPHIVGLVEGTEYYWCSCGLSKQQPFCDGSHQGTAFTPKPFKAEKSGEHYLCTCKESKSGPFCDGSHNQS